VAKIIKIGTWENGIPCNWHIDSNDKCVMKLEKIEEGGRVFVGDIEIVEWTEARKASLKKEKCWCETPPDDRTFNVTKLIPEKGEWRHVPLTHCPECGRKL